MAIASGGMAVGAAALIALGLLGALPLHATFGEVDLGAHRVSWLVPVASLSLVAAVVAYVTGIGAARIPGCPAVVVRRPDRGAVRRLDRLAGARRTANTRATAGRRPDRHRRRAGTPRRTVPHRGPVTPRTRADPADQARRPVGRTGIPSSTTIPPT